MADEVSHASKPQIVALKVSSDRSNPSKFFTHFLYKAALVTVFLVLLPLFPSLAPEFINQTLHARSWELLQLIFVGIAVSYGLFSKKNVEAEKDNHVSKLDNAHSYVSKLLQVSSVFDDESENQTVIEENKIQTLNSQYYRGEPLLLVAKESPLVKQENCVSSEISQKPLLLPVRSLKQRVSESNEVDFVDENNGLVNISSSKIFTSNSRKPKNSLLNAQNLEDKLEENVLRSPIPWRSRSGRLEMRENRDQEPDLINRLESKSFRPNSSSKNLSPSTSFSSESKPKSSDVARKKISSSPPPAPPPPPITPPFLRKSMLMKSNSNVMNNELSPEKILRRSAWSVPAEELNEIEDDGLAKSVRTFRSTSELIMATEKSSVDSDVPKLFEKKGSIDKMMNHNIPNEATETYMKRHELQEKVAMVTSDEDSEDESEDDYFEGSSGNGEAATDTSLNDVGPDVDKKADEFIAKFREQIRLQRIESIRKSTEQRAGKTFR